MTKEEGQAALSLRAELRPRSEAELASIVRDARAPIRVQGGGTRPAGDVAGEVLSTAGLTGIALYEPGALTVVAGAGTPLAELEAALAAEGQRLPFEPPDARRLMGTAGVSTIGGVVATNASGSRRIQAGACRDFLLGVRFVDGTGAVVKNGGRVMKNVTGYDLVKLMAGSRGTLGVLTEVALKVLPAPPASATLTVGGLAPDEAVRAMAAALGSPYEVTGAAYEPGRGAHLRIEGFVGSVRHRAERLRALLERFGPVSIEREPDAVTATWRRIRDAEPVAEAPGDVWRISVKPSDGERVAAALKDTHLLFDWGGGLVWAAVPQGTDVRNLLEDIGGHATLIRASLETRARLGTFHPEPAPVARLSRGLRERFDPRGILNPGLMG